MNFSKTCFFVLALTFVWVPTYLMGKYYINNSVVDMHCEPSIHTEMISQAIYGTEVTLGEEKDEWVMIHTPDRYSGWTHQIHELVSTLCL
jgi:Bacterial dipeptidyl-peptidase Sh3 domain